MWFVLLVPWFPFAFFAGMALDGPHDWKAYLFIAALWTYPINLYFAYQLRKKMGILALLPLLNVLGAVVSSYRPVTP